MNEPSRRKLLAGIGSVLGGVSVAGCETNAGRSTSPGASGGNASRPTVTTPALESHCSDGNTEAPDLYDDWFAQPNRSTYDGRVVTLSSFDLGVVSELPFSWTYLYTRRLFRTAGMATINFEETERALMVRPPGEEFASYLVFRNPMTKAERQAYVARLKTSLSRGGFPRKVPHDAGRVRDLEPVRGFERYALDIPRVSLIAFDDEWIVVVPKAYSSGAVTSSKHRRFAQLLATKEDRRHPFHCYHPTARLLLERLAGRQPDIVYAWLRTDGGRFASTERVPRGAQASAFTFRVNDAAREEINGPEFEVVTEPSTTTGSGGPPSSPTATPRRPMARLGMTVVFPEGAADVAAVKKHVRAKRMQANARGLLFEKPTYERSGRVVTVSERLPLGAFAG